MARELTFTEVVLRSPRVVARSPGVGASRGDVDGSQASNRQRCEFRKPGVQAQRGGVRVRGEWADVGFATERIRERGGNRDGRRGVGVGKGRGPRGLRAASSTKPDKRGLAQAAV